MQHNKMEHKSDKQSEIHHCKHVQSDGDKKTLSTYISCQCRKQSKKYHGDQPSVTFFIQKPLSPVKPKSCTQLTSKQETHKGRIPVLVEVTNIDIDQPPEGAWLDIYTKKISQLYEIVLKDTGKLIRVLQSHFDFSDIIVENIHVGSIAVDLICKTTQALDDLETSYREGNLAKIVTKVFVTNKVKTKMEIKDLELTPHIRDKDILLCRQRLSSGDRKEKVKTKQTGKYRNLRTMHVHKQDLPNYSNDLGPKKDLPSCNDDVGPKKDLTSRYSVTGTRKNLSSNNNATVPRKELSSHNYDVGPKRELSAIPRRSSLLRKAIGFTGTETAVVFREDTVDKFVPKLQSDIEHIEQKRTGLVENFGDLLMVLKLTKPRNMEKVCKIADILTCYNYLKESPSIGKSVRLDLLHDYLSFINLARIAVNDIKEKLQEADKQCTCIEKYKKIEKTELQADLGEFNNFIEPDFDFSTIEEDLPVHLNVMDKKAFHGFVCFLVFLFEKLQRIHVLFLDFVSSLKDLKM